MRSRSGWARLAAPGRQREDERGTGLRGLGPQICRRSPPQSLVRSRDRGPWSRPSLPRQKGWKTDSRSAAGIPGPSSATRITTASPSGVAVIANVAAGAGVTMGVVEQVDEDPACMGRIDLDGRQLRRDVDRDRRPRREPRPARRPRARPPTTAHAAGRTRRPRGARGRAGRAPSPRGEPSRSGSSRSAPRGRSRRAASSAVREPSGGRDDRGQRRAEVV